MSLPDSENDSKVKNIVALITRLLSGFCFVYRSILSSGVDLISGVTHHYFISRS